MLSSESCRNLQPAAAVIFREQAELPRSLLTMPDVDHTDRVAVLMWQDPSEPHSLMHATYAFDLQTMITAKAGKPVQDAAVEPPAAVVPWRGPSAQAWLTQSY